jgi:hypothetical protein
MSTPRPGAHNGGPVENRVSQPPMSSAQSLSRPFTLYEALPYTPFTSIVPFDSGILPAPTIGSVSPAPSLIGLVSSQEFDALNQEALGHDPLPRRLQQTANQIQHLVERNGITELYACSHAAAKRRSTDSATASSRLARDPPVLHRRSAHLWHRLSRLYPRWSTIRLRRPSGIRHRILRPNPLLRMGNRFRPAPRRPLSHLQDIRR